MPPRTARDILMEQSGRAMPTRHDFYRAVRLHDDAFDLAQIDTSTMPDLPPLEPFEASQPGASALVSEALDSIRNSSRQTDMSLSVEDPSVAAELKRRHLVKRERDSLHKPKSDVYEGGRGEACKNACTLEVDDIIIKFT